jgi:hypothetical protein
MLVVFYIFLQITPEQWYDYGKYFLRGIDKMNTRAIKHLIDNNRVEECDLELYFTKKHNGVYFSYRPDMNFTIKNKILDLMSEALTEKIHETQHLPYNPVGSLTGTFETIGRDEVEQFDQILVSFEDDNLDELHNMNKNQVSFYTIKIRIENQEIYFMRRFQKLAKFSKGLVGKITNNEFTEIETDFMGIQTDVDIICFENELLIFNHIALERIFDLHDTFTERANQTLQTLQDTNVFENFEDFSVGCLNNSNYIRRLMKIGSNVERTNLVLSNLNNKVNEIRQLDLNITISDEGVIVFEDRDQIGDILLLLSDANYVSVVVERSGQDLLA